jgi:hypothetical protein
VLLRSYSIVGIVKPRRLRWAQHIVRMETKNACTILIRKFLPLPEPRRRWEDNIKIDLRQRN